MLLAKYYYDKIIFIRWENKYMTIEEREQKKEKVKKPKRKKTKKHKRANNFVFWILRIALTPFMWFKWRIKFDYKTAKGLRRPCLIVCNHQTSMDQFAVGMGFSFGINFVASDTIFRHGFLSWLMRVIAKPIPFNKGTSDPLAIKSMMQVIEAKGCVGLFPEGNRSYAGETMEVQPGTGRLAKKLNVPVYVCNIQGGYLIKPRWKKTFNKGKCITKVVRVLSVEEMANLSGDDIQDIIQKELYVNEFDFAMQHKKPYKGKARTEFLEGLLFYCPKCKEVGGLMSKKHDLMCTKCGLVATVNQHIHFEYGGQEINNNDQQIFGTPKNPFPTMSLSVVDAVLGVPQQLPSTILDWSKLQEKFVEEFDVSSYIDTPIFSDENATFSKVEYAKKQTEGTVGTLKIYNNRLNICDTDFYFDTLKAVTVTESRKLSFFTLDGTAYAVDVPRRTNVIKYKQFFEKIRGEK